MTLEAPIICDDCRDFHYSLAGGGYSKAKAIRGKGEHRCHSTGGNTNAFVLAVDSGGLCECPENFCKWARHECSCPPLPEPADEQCREHAD